MLNEPVAGEQFFGRSEILGLIERRIHALKQGYRQNIALTGQSLSGKSSIIHHLLFNLRDERIIPVYIEVVEEPFNNFRVKFIGSLLYNFLRSVGETVKEDIAYLIEKSKNHIPNTIASVERISGLNVKLSREEIYSELFNLTSYIKEETRKSCIIIFDEFHNLGLLGIKNPFSIFGKKIMVQKDTMYIVTSSRVSSVRKILSEKLSLLFGNFEAIEVNGFDLPTAQRFLKTRFTNIRVSEEYQEFLISFTALNPFYLDVLSNRIKELGENSATGNITEEMFINAFQDQLFDFKGIANQYLTNYIEAILKKLKGGKNLMSSLIAISLGAARPAEIAHQIKKKRSDVSRYVSELIDSDIIIKPGNICLFNDHILSFWLKNVYQKKRSSIISYIPQRAKDFNLELKKILNEFLGESKKELANRLQDLLILFNNDTIVIGHKNYSLPKFDDVKIKESACGFLSLVGLVKEKSWLVNIKDGELKDLDIMEFIEHSRPFKNSIQRKIIVAPAGIDINANILAKDEKIWIWDLKTLNLLMSLYRKPVIVSYLIKGGRRV